MKQINISPANKVLALEAFNRLAPKLVEALIEKRRDNESAARPPIDRRRIEEFLNATWNG